MPDNNPLVNLREEYEAAGGDAERADVIEGWRKTETAYAAAIREVTAGSAAQVAPLANWRDTPPPEPVIWHNPGDNREPWPLVSVGEPGVLSAPGSSGKSYVALALACGAAAGDNKALGLHVRPGPAVLVAYEDSPARLARRVSRMQGDGGIPAELHVLPDPGPLWEGDPDNRGAVRCGPSWEALCAACEELQPSLVIVDPAGEALADVDAAQGSAVRTLYRELCRLPGEPGVLIIAHDTKSARNLAKTGEDPGAGAVAGSAAWFDRARGVGYLRSIDDGRMIEIIKSNHGLRGWGVVLEAAENRYGDFIGFRDGRYLPPQAVADAIKNGTTAQATGNGSDDDELF